MNRIEKLKTDAYSFEELDTLELIQVSSVVTGMPGAVCSDGLQMPYTRAGLFACATFSNLLFNKKIELLVEAIVLADVAPSLNYPGLRKV